MKDSVDSTTKMLLALLVLGVWGILLRLSFTPPTTPVAAMVPMVAPLPASAQLPSGTSNTALTVLPFEDGSQGARLFIAGDGKVSTFFVRSDQHGSDQLELQDSKPIP